MIAALVRPREGPAVAVIVAQGAVVGSAQLMRVEVVVASREALSCPLKTCQRETGVEPHIKRRGTFGLGLAGGVAGRVAVQVLRDERPMSRRFQARTKTREACLP